MKKIIAILLILITLLSISSCQEKEEITDTISIVQALIDENNHLIIYYNNETTKDLGEIKTKSITNIDINDNGELLITYSNGEHENLGQIVSEDVWRERNDIIYTTAKTIVRTEPSQDAKVYKVIEYKTKIQRIGTNGTWNKIKIDDTILYIKADCTTTNIDDITFEKTEPTVVYTNNVIFKKEYPCENPNTSIGLSAYQTQLIKIEENVSKTWIKVKYGNETFYCKTTEVTTEPLPG